MWATHALGISYEIKKTQGIGSGQVLFFPISRSICNAFHYLSSVDNDLQSKQTANDKIYSAKPDQTHLWVPLVLFLFARWETVAMSTTSQSSGTAIELGVRLEIESQTKRGCHKKGWQRKPHKSMQTRAQVVNSHHAYGKWKSWASLQVGCLSPSFPPALCINL